MRRLRWSYNGGEIPRLLPHAFFFLLAWWEYAATNVLLFLLTPVNYLHYGPCRFSAREQKGTGNVLGEEKMASPLDG